MEEIYCFIEVNLHLPLKFSSGRTYFETGPRMPNFSMLAFISSTYSSNFLTTSVTLHKKENIFHFLNFFLQMMNYIQGKKDVVKGLM